MIKTVETMGLSYVEMITGNTVKATIVWLHGLGADGHDFANLVPQLNLPPDFGIHFIFPHAPIRPITINQGMPMRGWYDIASLTRLEDDVPGILESCNAVEHLLQQQIQSGVSPNQIILAGFSQGGAIALHTALNFKEKIGGVLALSTYLPATQQLLSGNIQKELSIFLAHGTHDDVIPLFLAESAKNWLIAKGFMVDWHAYPMAHQVCMPEIEDIKNWLISTLLTH